jgi:cysteine synthase A
MSPFENILATIGVTPLVHLRNLSPPGAASVYGKFEAANPGGSVKDRICLAMIEAAERDGRLRPGGVIVEPTSGNTGIGLALVAAVKGYRCILTMPDSMSLERRQVLAAFGAELVLTKAEDGMDGAIRKAEEILAAHDDAFMPQQFMNPANPDAHERTTGPELAAAMGGASIDAFVAGVGTGGTITGVGRFLRRHHPAARVVAVEPATSALLSGGAAGPHKIQGIGAGFVPDVVDRGVIDEVLTVTDRDAYATKMRLAREEGLLLGISSGANVHAALVVAARLGPQQNVIVMLCDYGDRYFSLDEYFADLRDATQSPRQGGAGARP